MRSGQEDVPTTPPPTTARSTDPAAPPVGKRCPGCDRWVCDGCDGDLRQDEWTDEHFRVTDEAIRTLRKAIGTIGDFLTPEEHAELSEGLAEMVRLRRRAIERSAHVVLP